MMNDRRDTQLSCLCWVFVLTVGATGCASITTGSLHDRLKASADRSGNLEANGLSKNEQAHVCLQTGLNLAKHQRDEHAIAQLKKARSLNPKMQGVAHPLAVLYDRQGRFGAAQQEYERALQEGRPTAALLNDIGFFKYSQGQLADAQVFLEKAIQQDPEHEQAPLNLAMTHAAKGDYDQAYQLFQEAVGTAAAHQNIGLLMLRAGHEDQAMAHLNQARSIDPSLQTSATLVAEHTSRTSDANIVTVGYEN